MLDQKEIDFVNLLSMMIFIYIGEILEVGNINCNICGIRRKLNYEK